MSGRLVIISGPSGVGKSTIASAVVQRLGAKLSVSATTRDMRPGEVDGVNYHFLAKAEFERLIVEDGLLEHAQVYDHHYGTPRAPVEAALAAGRTVVLEIDVQGAVQVKRKLPSARGVFILPPSEDELLRRLRARGREDEARIQRRFQAARAEIEAARTCGAYDFFVVNDRLEPAIEEAVRAATA